MAKTFTVKGVDPGAVTQGIGARTSRTGTVAVRDAHLPRQLDLASLGATDQERLTRLEEIIDKARVDMAETVRAARRRFELEAGTALRLIREQPRLYQLAGYRTFEDYVRGRFGYSPSRAYQFCDMPLVMGAVSTIVETTPPESQIRILATIVRQHGEQAARDVLARAQQRPERLTAKTLAAVRDSLGYGTATERGDDDPDVIDAEVVDEVPACVADVREGLDALRRAARLLTLKNVTEALGHDAALAEQVLDGYDQSGTVRRVLRRAVDQITG